MISARPRPFFWKGFLAATIAFGVFAALVSFYPAYSRGFAIVSVLLWAAGVVAAAWGIQTHYWWLQLTYWEVFLLFFFAMAMRAWSTFLSPGQFVIVLAAALALHLLAWGFPWIAPRLSARWAKEQLAPTTRAGRFIQSFSLAIVPGVGGLIYLVERMKEGQDVQNLDTVLIAILGSVLAIGGPQAISQQFWEKKPWAKSHRGVGA